MHHITHTVLFNVTSLFKMSFVLFRKSVTMQTTIKVVCLKQHFLGEHIHKSCSTTTIRFYTLCESKNVIRFNQLIMRRRVCGWDYYTLRLYNNILLLKATQLYYLCYVYVLCVYVLCICVIRYTQYYVIVCVILYYLCSIKPKILL